MWEGELDGELHEEDAVCVERSYLVLYFPIPSITLFFYFTSRIMIRFSLISLSHIYVRISCSHSSVSLSSRDTE